VATRSQVIKWIIKKFLDRTSDISDPDLKLHWSLHDFGMRGCSSEESAGIAGAAHLVNFYGTDTIDAIRWIRDHYGPTTPDQGFEMPGFSIPASEHSVSTVYGGGTGEVEYARAMLKAHGSRGKLYANVADTYDVFNFCRNVLPQIKDELEASGATLVVRPDSSGLEGPTSQVLTILDILAQTFGHAVNSKGYKVLNTVRIIQGDGVLESSIASILEAMQINKYSAENIAFGCGGYLLQAMTRDTQKFAFKCSAASINGQWRDIFKNPVTDPSKRSKPGRLTLYRNGDGVYYTSCRTNDAVHEDMLEAAYKDGKLMREQSLADVRARSVLE
jgi:nicotinamide phosphoribosyltransferase